MTGGQVGPTTPLGSVATTMPYGNFERPFNLVHLAESSGAVYVARWTTYHVRQATKAIAEALNKKGFSFVEILSPCPTLYSRRNRLGDGLAFQKFLKQAAIKKDGADTANAGVGFQESFIVGKFIDRERPLWREQHDEVLRKKLGDRFVPYQAPNEG
jgi:2-oxoglutarate ferredoxin oxidoreductase subunit beta